MFYTVFLNVAAVKEEVEERESVGSLFGCRYTLFINLEDRITILINVACLVKVSETSTSYLVGL